MAKSRSDDARRCKSGAFSEGFAAISGGREFAEWLAGLHCTSGPLAFVAKRELDNLSTARTRSPWLAGQAITVLAEARAVLDMPIKLPTLVNGHGHEFFCVDGVLLSPLPDDAGGQCPHCGREYRDERYKQGSAYVSQLRFIRAALVLATAYAIEPDEAFAAKVMDILGAFADLYSRHGQIVRQTLDEAWRITALASAFDLVSAAPNIAETQRADVAKRLLQASAYRIWRGYDPLGNWGACHDLALGTVGLTLRDGQLLHLALDGFMRRAHAYFHPDGLGNEGSIGTYHLMTVANMVSLAEALRPAGLNLYEARFRRAGQQRIIEAVLDAPIALAYPDTRLPALHDGWYFNGCLLPPDLYEMGWLRYGKPEYRKVADIFYTQQHFQGESAQPAIQRSKRMDFWPGIPLLMPSYPLVWDYYIRSLFVSADEWVSTPGALFPPPEFWAAQAAEVKPQPQQKATASALHQASAHFSDSGYVVMRSPESDTYLLCDYGPHGGGHGHPDKLNLVLFAQGQVMAPDYGTPAYGLESSGKWYRRSLSHNTVLVDGADQKPGPADLHLLDLAGQRQEMRVALGHAYPGTSIQRHIVLENDVILVVDSIQSIQPHTYDWLLHARGRLVLPPDMEQLDVTDSLLDYTYMRDCRWFGVGTEGKLSWQGSKDTYLHLRWITSCPATLLTAAGPGMPVERYDPLVSLRVAGTTAWYAVLLEPGTVVARVQQFAVHTEGGALKYVVTLAGDAVVSGRVPLEG